MCTYQVWQSKPMGCGLKEKCVRNEAGDYVGVETGTLYPAADHYHSEQLAAQIVAVDEFNETGMYHLYQELANDYQEKRRTFKEKFIGCFVTVEAAHNMGQLKIYRCRELNEYFSETEIKLI